MPDAYNVCMESHNNGIMDYASATPEQIAIHFKTITRQRISQVYLLHKKRGLPGDAEVAGKIAEAKKLLKLYKFIAKNGCTVEVYEKTRGVWIGMTERIGISPSYIDCTNAFPSESYFRAWASVQVGFYEKGFELDKDILVKGNRVYGPDTCVFVPAEVNACLAGCYKAKRRGQYPIGVCFNKGSGTFVAQMNKDRSKSLDKYLGSFKTVEEAFACYKQAKEEKIKRLAEKWKDRIDPRAYAALMARTVEWDD